MVLITNVIKSNNNEQEGAETAMKTRLLIIALFALFVLAGCTPYPADPYDQIRAGMNLQSSGNSALQATQQERLEQAEQNALQATATAGAQSARGTSQALESWRLSSQATASADARLAQIARITAQAVEAQATQSAFLSSLSLSATQTTTAIGLETERQAAERDRDMDAFTAWLIRSTLFVLVGGICAYMIYTLWRLRHAINEWIDWRIEWLDRRQRLFETRSGTVMVAPNGDGTYTIQLVSTSLPRPNLRHYDIRTQTDLDHVQALTPSGSVLMSPPVRRTPDGVTVLAVELIRTAVHLGWTGERIPGHRDLQDWSGATWSRAIAALKAADAVETDSTGTYVSNRYQCTVDLLDDLESGKLRVRPAPSAVELTG